MLWLHYLPHSLSKGAHFDLGSSTILEFGHRGGGGGDADKLDKKVAWEVLEKIEKGEKVLENKVGKLFEKLRRPPTQEEIEEKRQEAIRRRKRKGLDEAEKKKSELDFNPQIVDIAKHTKAVLIEGRKGREETGKRKGGYKKKKGALVKGQKKMTDYWGAS